MWSKLEERETPIEEAVKKTKITLYLATLRQRGKVELNLKFLKCVPGNVWYTPQSILDFVLGYLLQSC